MFGELIQLVGERAQRTDRGRTRVLKNGLLGPLAVSTDNRPVVVARAGCGRYWPLFEVLPSRVELQIVRVIDAPQGHPHPLPRPSLSRPARGGRTR
jgi:hypothetical protein